MTNSSRLEYIHRVAHFKLNVQPKRASDAFRIGLEKVIPHEWLRMFNEGELQVCPHSSCNCSIHFWARTRGCKQFAYHSCLGVPESHKCVCALHSRHPSLDKKVALQALIGGGDHQGLDIADMKSHVNYAGGYHEDHPVIKEFWNVSSAGVLHLCCFRFCFLKYPVAMMGILFLGHRPCHHSWTNIDSVQTC